MGNHKGLLAGSSAFFAVTDLATFKGLAVFHLILTFSAVSAAPREIIVNAFKAIKKQLSVFLESGIWNQKFRKSLRPEHLRFCFRVDSDFLNFGRTRMKPRCPVLFAEGKEDPVHLFKVRIGRLKMGFQGLRI